METLKTSEFRVSFPNVFTPSAFPGQTPKYGITMLFPKTADLKALKALAKQAVEKKWPDPVKRAKIMANPNFKNPFRDGDLEKPDTAGYEGMIFIRATSKIKPGVVDRNVQPIVGEEEFYAGCYARATVTAYGFDTAGNTGVAFGLQNVQKLRDGEHFSGRLAPEAEFEALDGGDVGGFTLAANGAQGTATPAAAKVVNPAAAAVKPAPDMFA